MTYNRIFFIFLFLTIFIIGIFFYFSRTKVLELSNILPTKFIASAVKSDQGTSVIKNSKYFTKKTLVFSIDQTWLNGVVNTEDMVSLDRMVASLLPLKDKYEIYVVLNPGNKDQDKVLRILDFLSKNQISFVLDQYSSDTHESSIIKPYDKNHGIALSVSDLKKYKQRYGDYFAGIRIFEVFAANFSLLTCKKFNVDWCSSYKPNHHLVPERFYNKDIAETYIKFAHENGMFVLWSDFYWSFFSNWEFDRNVVMQPQNEKELSDLIKKYPGTVLVSFANNFPNGGALKNNYVNTWFKNFKKFESDGGLGFGLSNQSWMCNTATMCQIDEIIKWTEVAFNNGAKVVQFEPAWYFWNLPTGTLDQWLRPGENPITYAKESKWRDRGYPKETLKSLASTLGVSLEKVSKIEEINDSQCVSIEAPSQVKVDSVFDAKVTFVNNGSKDWVSSNSITPDKVYKVGALDFKMIPPYKTSIWGQPNFEIKEKSVVKPGEQITFNLKSKAPSSNGRYDYGWQMYEHGVAWFGQSCSKRISVYKGVPEPLNVQAQCKNGRATVSWDSPYGYNSFYLRVKKWPFPNDGSAIKWDDNYKSGSFTFDIQPGQTYNWWVHTRDGVTGEHSTAIGTTFACN